MASAPDVIELLETYLETARTSDWQHIAIAMVGHPNRAAVDFGGEIALEISTKEALAKLSDKLDASIANWSLPSQDESLDASYVVYNMASWPLGFDFLMWLVTAEMTRRRKGAPGPLKVAFWIGADATEQTVTGRRRMWLDKVFRPSLRLIGAVEDAKAMRGWRSEVFTSREIVAAAKRGEQVPTFSADWPCRIAPAITITLREVDYWSHRNSNLGAWYKFACLLRKEGKRVVFVRDTKRAHEPFEDFVTSPMASIDLEARMALYQDAECNFFVSNGPGILALFSKRPWIQFVPIEDEDNPAYAANTRWFWTKNMGIVPGEQHPWSAPDQRIVWDTDSYENIVAAWEQYKSLQQRAA